MTDRTFLDRSLLSFVGNALGVPVVTVRDLSWTGRPPAVLELGLADGGRAVAKLHDAPDKHRREVIAYRTWGPWLAPQLPRLLAVRDVPPRAIVLEALPGRAAPDGAARSGAARSGGRPTPTPPRCTGRPAGGWPACTAFHRTRRASIGWAARHDDASLEAEGRSALATVLDEAR